MKKSIIILTILVSILSCNIQKSKYQISGNWYSCGKNGDYVEMHIKENKYKYSSGFGITTDWNEFEIKGDTVYQFDKFTFEDSTITNKAKFRFLNNEKLELEYLTSDEKWVLYKFEKKIKNIENIENNLKLQEETKQRSKERKCLDLRTDKEKDLIDKKIDFRF